MKGIKVLFLLIALINFKDIKAQDISLSTLNRFMEWTVSETQSALRQWGWRILSDEPSNSNRVITYGNMGRILCYLYNYNGKCLRYIYTVHVDHVDYIKNELRSMQFVGNHYDNDNRYVSEYKDYYGNAIMLTVYPIDSEYYQLMVECADFEQQISLKKSSKRPTFDFETLSDIIANKESVQKIGAILLSVQGWEYMGEMKSFHTYLYQSGDYSEIISFLSINDKTMRIFYGVPQSAVDNIKSQIKLSSKYLKQTKVNNTLCNEYYCTIKGIKVYTAITVNKQVPDNYYYISMTLTQM